MTSKSTRASVSAFRSLVHNLEGHAVPAVCVFSVIGWVHVALAYNIHLPMARTSLAFDNHTTKVLEALLK
jgi:hypothetical protein